MPTKPAPVNVLEARVTMMNLPRAAALVIDLVLALAACSNGPGTEDGDVAASASPRTPSAAGTASSMEQTVAFFREHLA